MAKKSGKKIILYSVIAVVILILIILVIKKAKNNDGKKVAIEKVEKRTIIETVSANGTIQPTLNVKISPYISGEVVGLYVKEGEHVKTGQKLAKIDPKIYLATYKQTKASLETSQAQAANAKARIAQAEANLMKAKLNFERSKKLWKKQVISDSDYDNALSSYEVAKADVTAAKETYKANVYQVKSVQAQLDQASENLSRTTIYSPNSGNIANLSIEVGERVTGASQFSSGTEIMKVADLNNMEVDVQVNENDIVQVALNDTALIEVDSYFNREFKGIVTEISTAANTSGVSADQITNFNVKIKMLKSSYKDLIRYNQPIPSPFRPGMTATVEIQTKRADNVLSVPIQAVTTRKDSAALANLRNPRLKKQKTNKKTEPIKKTQEYVFVYEKGIAKLQKVTTGIQNNTYIQIKSGLKAGQEIITAPYLAVSKTLKNNDKVTAVPIKELFSTKK